MCGYVLSWRLSFVSLHGYNSYQLCLPDQIHLICLTNALPSYRVCVCVGVCLSVCTCPLQHGPSCKIVHTHAAIKIHWITCLESLEKVLLQNFQRLFSRDISDLCWHAKLHLGKKIEGMYSRGVLVGKETTKDSWKRTGGEKKERWQEK